MILTRYIAPPGNSSLFLLQPLLLLVVVVLCRATAKTIDVGDFTTSWNFPFHEHARHFPKCSPLPPGRQLSVGVSGVFESHVVQKQCGDRCDLRSRRYHSVAAIVFHIADTHSARSVHSSNNLHIRVKMMMMFVKQERDVYFRRLQKEHPVYVRARLISFTLKPRRRNEAPSKSDRDSGFFRRSRILRESRCENSNRQRTSPRTVL